MKRLFSHVALICATLTIFPAQNVLRQLWIAILRQVWVTFLRIIDGIFIEICLRALRAHGGFFVWLLSCFSAILSHFLTH